MGKTDTKLRHIDVAQCWLRQSVQRGELCVDYVPTNQMVADGLTKVLPPQKHQHFVKLLGLVDAMNLINEKKLVNQKKENKATN